MTRHITVLDEGSPVVVTATLVEPLVDTERYPLMLDGPLAWACAMWHHATGRRMPPMTREHVPDLPLPLSRWQMPDEPDVWGWCASAADYQPVRHTAVQVRRKPATAAMARYAPDAKHHLALGPHKARDTTHPAMWVDRLVWHALTTDFDRLAEMVEHLTHLGKKHAIGYGRVRKVRVEPGSDPDAWTDRPLPDPAGQMVGVRAPYWHPTRRHPCTWVRPANATPLADTGTVV